MFKLFVIISSWTYIFLIQIIDIRNNKQQNITYSFLSDDWSQVIVRPVYKSISDSVFNKGDLILCPEIRYELQPNLIIVESPSQITEIATFIKKHSTIVFEIGCHTDSRGSISGNLELSRNRAKAIKDELIHNFDIAPDQVLSKGYGESVPIYSDNVIDKIPLEKQDEFHSQNRRTELKVLEIGEK